jgi:hypothetical protein
MAQNGATVDGSDEQRAAKEVLFREVNEQLEEINEELDGKSDSVMSLICECGKTNCHEKIDMPRKQYEALRANPKHFAVLPGHEDTRIARVIERHQGFFIAEKIGEAAEMAIEHDPRTD